jgi:hypothetical protein
MTQDCLIAVPWETRNIGRQCFSVTDDFKNNPDESILRNEISRKTNEFGKIFVQVRVYKNELGLIPILTNNSFSIIETCLVATTNFNSNPVFKNFIINKRGFVPSKIDSTGLNMLKPEKVDSILSRELREIARNAFSDDRFHLDPMCSKETADRRFENWLGDLIDDASVNFCVAQYHGHTIGFTVYRNEDIVLGCFEKQYQQKGLGAFFILSTLEIMRDYNKIYHMQTVISVNNISILNLYVRMGFKFRKPFYTFHYWGM